MHLSVLYLLAAAAADSVLSGPVWTAEGNQLGAWFGCAVASAGDVNGDGYSDVIVGAQTYDNGEIGEGRAFVYLGGEDGLSSTPAWTAEGNQTNAEFGNSVATAGDVNGDGFSDVIVAAYQYDNGESNEGRVFVYLGSSTGLATTAAWTAEGDQVEAAFGMAVATAGDVNDDGYSDVIIGAWQYDNGESNEGRAFVYLGSRSGLSASPAWTAESDQVDARFGISVATAGDIDGDGFDDVIVGADQFDGGEFDEGRAFVYRGSRSGVSASAVWTTESDQAEAHLGMSVATAGDVNGDGFADAIVGAIFYSNGEMSEGRALVFSGSSTGLSASPVWTAESNRDFTSFGSTVATAGDVNGDGYSDVIVAAHGYEDGLLNEGATFVYLGSSTGLSTDAAWSAEGNQFAARFGWSAAAAGDVNADGYTDVIVGANLYQNGQASEGRAFLFTGSCSGLATSPTPLATLGRTLANAGDVDGDGYTDLIVGQPAYSLSRGRASVYLGSGTGLSETPVWSLVGPEVGAEFGYAVASAGDVNGDGYSDVIVGARFHDPDNQGFAFLYLGSSTGPATTPAWQGQGQNVGAEYGAAVASAGDVNGDGFSDVIIGAPVYGSLNGGRALVYHGSSAGLSPTAAWIVTLNSFAADFGGSVASAGDVNADGYGDVLVGAQYFMGAGGSGETQEGSAYLYLGSAHGLTLQTAWTAESNQDYANFGGAVATAGDVNGDGYSDVLVGSPGFDNPSLLMSGAVFLYLGSSTGISPIPNWTGQDGQPQANYGRSVAAAGDVNCDGYGDVIVSAPQYDGPQTDEGRACVYFGSSTGLSTSASWTADGDQAGMGFGVHVSSGDFNGDGFSDVISSAAPGSVRVFFGNEGRGSWTFALQQRQAHDVAPIQLLGRSVDPLRFRIHLAFAREFAGFSWASGATPFAKLEWQVQPLGSRLDVGSVSLGGGEGIDGSLIRFNELAAFEDEFAPLTAGIGHHTAGSTRLHHWRARVRTNNPLFPVTPWVTLAGNHETEAKLRSGLLRPQLRAK